MIQMASLSCVSEHRRDTFDAIVLVEGSEGNVFVNPSLWLEPLRVLVVNCGGFPGVGRGYEELAPDWRDRLLPTVDQDSLEKHKSKSNCAAWTSTNLYMFTRDFEDVFDDWILASAISRKLAKPEWEITEREVKDVRSFGHGCTSEL